MRQYPLREYAHSRASRSGMPAALRLRSWLRAFFHSFQRTCRNRLLSHRSSFLSTDGVSANAK